ncbi:MAG TPA: VCBS repeat-containing protein [Planctomycetota bacterium]|nr:VCBS repeat-containing protein [Planctomycetota bacterium]
MVRAPPAAPLACLLAAAAAAQDDLLFRTQTLQLPQFAGTSIATADLDLDGRPDLVVEHWGKLLPVAGRGDGSFVLDEALAVPGLNGGAPTSDLALADGHVDLVTCSNGLNQDFVVRGHGDGTFEAPKVIGARLAPNGVSAGDWNGDGLPDFAVVHSVSSNAVQVHLNSGAGFLPALAVSTNLVDQGITRRSLPGGQRALRSDREVPAAVQHLRRGVARPAQRPAARGRRRRARAEGRVAARPAVRPAALPAVLVGRRGRAQGLCGQPGRCGRRCPDRASTADDVTRRR